MERDKFPLLQPLHPSASPKKIQYIIYKIYLNFTILFGYKAAEKVWMNFDKRVNGHDGSDYYTIFIYRFFGHLWIIGRRDEVKYFLQ